MIDRLKISDAIKTRLTDSLELALKTGSGVVTVLFGPPDAITEELTLSNQNFDPETGYRYAEITPRHFSFNSPQGACPVCDGLGTESVFDPALIIPDGAVPLEDMPVAPWRRASPALAKLYQGPADRAGRGLQRADVAALPRVRRRFPARAARRHGRGENRFHHARAAAKRS